MDVAAACSASAVAAPTSPSLLFRAFSVSVKSSRGRHSPTVLPLRALQTSSRLIWMASSSSQTAPSWEDLAKELREHNQEPFRLSHATTRLFEGSAPALTFYRDNSSWCPYCERVWLQLEEKRIPYEVEKINMSCYGSKPDWYLQMIPTGLLPAVNLAGKVIPESLDIMMILEDSFPQHKPLLPPKNSVEKRNTVTFLLKQERRLVGAWLSSLRGGMWGSMDSFNRALDDVDASLKQSGGPYFLGQESSRLLHLTEVDLDLKTIDEDGGQLHPLKCKLDQPKPNPHGQLISENDITLDLTKVECSLLMESSTTKEVMGFAQKLTYTCGAV